MAAALARHDVILEQLVIERAGHLVRPRGEGDSRFAVFARASDAVAAACAVQITFVEERWNLPEPLRVRMAVHTGEADIRLGDYYGPAVNHCARLRAIAHGGQVLVSPTTVDLVRESLSADIRLRDLGLCQLRDLDRAERIWQLVHPALPADFPPLRSQEPAFHNLPNLLSSFVGRDREVAEVARLLQTTRLVTLTGAGGVGKTRIALQVAKQVALQLKDGGLFVPLSPVTDPLLVISTLAQLLGVREAGDRPLPDMVKDVLRQRDLLLVLDNFEQVLAAASTVSELLSACPQLKVLVTSRAVLHISGEHTYAIMPLEIPERHPPTPLEKLTQYDAVRLFIERARASRSNFAVTNETAPAVAEICARLDGLPLAIELAAAQVRALTPQTILTRLGHRLELLVGGSRDEPERHQTLRAAIAWSYDLLTPSERSVFRRLAVFVGGCQLGAAEAVLGTSGLPSAPDQPNPDVLYGLISLVEQGLVLADEQADGETRFKMLETIREYALERFANTPSSACELPVRKPTSAICTATGACSWLNWRSQNSGAETTSCGLTA
jgi:predicted ATPase